jgi:cytochrome P450
MDLSTISLDSPPEAIDPSEEFSKQWGGTASNDPYPMFEEFRASGPVVDRDIFVELGAVNTWNADGRRKVYSVVGYDAVRECLSRTDVFSSGINAEASAHVRGRNLNMIDPPEHTRLRGILQKSFTPARVHEWMEGLIKPEIDGLLAAIKPRGKADLDAEFSYVLPYKVTHKMFRLSERDYDNFHDLGIWTLLYFVRPEHAAWASKALTLMLQDQIDSSRGQEGTDVVTLLANAELDGERMTDEEIVAFLRLLIPAGAETTTRGLALTFFALLTHPEQLQLLRDQPELTPKAVTEGLRWQVPFGIEPRLVTRDTELAGVDIPAGALVLPCLSAANRDPEYFPDPEVFDIRREGKGPILSFGFSAHVCLGMNLAKGEIDAALRAILTELPNLRLDPDAPEPQMTGVGARGVDHLRVVFDPSAA